MKFDVYVSLTNGWGYIFHVEDTTVEEQVTAYLLGRHAEEEIAGVQITLMEENDVSDA